MLSMRQSIPCVFLACLLVAAAGCKEEGTIQVHSITFQGVKSVDSGELKNALATQVSSKLPWGKKKYFDRSRFDTDLKRIQAFYADRGFPDARVTGFDVKLNQKQDQVDVAITINEGQPIDVAAIDFVGFDVIPPAHFDELKKTAPLKVGQPRDRRQVVSTHEMALNELRDHGYPYAKVRIDENDGANGHAAAMTFTAEPGTLAHFGPVEISGNQSVGDNVIRRELTFKPGDLYSRSEVQDSQRRLYGMELFQFVNIETVNPEQQNPTVPTRVTVAEGKHQRLNFGVGYGTDEKERVDAQYHHLNFLGGARTAGLHARWSSLDRGVRADFNQPYVFRPHFSLGLEGQQWYTYTPAYRSVVSGGKATVTHRANPSMSYSMSLTSEHDSSSISDLALSNPAYRNDLIALGLDPRTNQQTGTLNALGLDLQRSTADNLLNAHHGYQLALHFEEAGRVLPGTFHYYAASIDGRHYLPLSPRLVWANRIEIGNIDPIGSGETEIPFSKRYFLGGASSVRGWGIYELSPLVAGLPVGGDSMLAFTTEMRAGVSGNIGLVAFLDGGNVWANTWGYHLNDLRYAIGPGFRYQTPVGPIRLDFGWQLNPIPGLIVNGSPQTRRWRIHFSIGQAF